MQTEGASTPTAIEPDTVRQITTVTLAAAAVIVLVSFASLLPGANWLVPGTPVTIGAALTAVATIAVVALLVILAPALERLVRSSLREPSGLTRKAGTTVRITTVLVAVLIAHRGLADAVQPLLGSVSWAYDIVFLILSLPLLVALAVVLYTSLEPTAEACTSKLLGTGQTDQVEDTDVTIESSNEGGERSSEGSEHSNEDNETMAT
ncbi:hypothetical protein [Natronosalvus vescus]|uniref:hypothetical protein n=1 Tax=Natronosalvus vescus TaxID=2953881 RepID=UPI002090E868|nr:hypothetical protein [Natronosalvus vescus]